MGHRGGSRLRAVSTLSCSSFFAALFIVLAKGTLAPSFAGAALNFALSSGGIIGFSVILATDLEVRRAGPWSQHGAAWAV